LPPASAGGIWSNIALALAKKLTILAKANTNLPNLSLQLKLEAIKVLLYWISEIATILLINFRVQK
jgi:hypothetical protein